MPIKRESKRGKVTEQKKNSLCFAPIMMTVHITHTF